MSISLSDHRSLVQAIMQGKLFPVAEHETFDLIETHISSVIVCSEMVYKLKKPIDLGFLDFSTLEKRRYYCAEEIRLNRRLSPQLYIDVMAIYGTPEAPTLQQSGDAIEYLVRMKPFAQTAQLDRLLQQHKLSVSMILRFADYLADFHRDAARADASNAYGKPETIRKPVDENFIQIRSLVSNTEILQQLARIESWSEQAFARINPSLTQRKAQGFIRECHGDLHLRNLAWMNDQPLAFDCIEFDPELYWIDVISDLSFLWMDLLVNQQTELAWALLNQYLSRSGDYASLALLDFYTVYRAMVRAKIAAISASQAQGETAQAALDDLAKHLEFIQQYTRSSKALIYLMHGPSASGKSTLSRELVAPLQAIVLRSDIERKRLFGLDAQQPAADAPEQGIYSDQATDKTYQHLLDLARVIIQSGYSVIVDATFSRPAQRQLFYDLAADIDTTCLVLELKVSESNLRQRIQQRRQDVSDADINILQHQLSNWQPLADEELKYSLQINLDEGLDAAAISTSIQQKTQALMAD